MNSTSMTKQAERSFFPGSTMPMPSTERSAPVPEGGIHLTPEQLEYIRAGDKAWVEGFNEGLAGALAGDGYRGVARGALNTTAATIDSLVDPPVRLVSSPALLLAHAITAMTGSTKAEDKVRRGREGFVDLVNFFPHVISNGMRSVANSKALDPKYLTPEAYVGSERAGQLGAAAAEWVLTKKVPGAFWWKYFLPVTLGDATVETIDKTVQEIQADRRRQASHDAMVDYFLKKTERPPGPVDWYVPELKSNLFNDLAQVEALNDSRGLERLQEIQDSTEKLEDLQIEKQLKRLGKRIAGAGIGGTAGLIAAHQITKRIPALQKRRILRYLINSAAAVGGGYAGYKLMGK